MVSTIVEIIEAYQPYILVLLLCVSTIVEIIEAYQPADAEEHHQQIYNSRNYRSLLAPPDVALSTWISTIVEIIEAYQPSNTFKRMDEDLQQQKLQKLTSHKLQGRFPLNLQQQKLQKLTSLIEHVVPAGCDLQQQKLQKLTSQSVTVNNTELSTIVEIIEAYQPFFVGGHPFLSTIVEIIEAYQPINIKQGNTLIYNSRNYRSLLALAEHVAKFARSTIVEIIEAYQPVMIMVYLMINLQQQKLQKLTSPSLISSAKINIYNSRNYRSLLASIKKKTFLAYLQQQKLQKLTSPV